MSEVDDQGEHLRSVGRARIVDSPVMRAVIVALFALIGLVVGVVLTGQQEQRYESTVRLLVGPIGGDRSTLDAAGLLSRTYVDLVSSRDAVANAAASVGAQVDPDDVSAVTDERSRVMLVTGTHDDRSVPQRVATALADDLIDRVGDADDEPGLPPGATGADPGQVRVLDDATDPAEPVDDQQLLIVSGYTALGALIGLFATRATAAMIRRTVDEPFIERNGVPALSVRYDMRDPWSDALNSVRTMLGLSPRAGPGDVIDELDLAAANLHAECSRRGQYRSIVFLPADDDPAAADAVLNLAAAGARSGRAIAIYDADSAGRRITGLVDVDYDPEHPASLSPEGADHLLGPGAVPMGSGRWQIPEGGSISFIDADEAADEQNVPGEAALLQEVTRRIPKGTTLLVMAPPVGESPVSLSSAAIADRVIVLVRERRTHKMQLTRVLRALGRLGREPTAVMQLDVAARRPRGRQGEWFRPDRTGGQEGPATAAS